MTEKRRLGNTEIKVTPVAMGCWPIAGMTSLNVNDADSLKTLHAAIDSGINFFDTAYCYGANGESERLIAQAIVDRRDSMVIATKGGVHWNADGQRDQDARAETLVRQCDESLLRLGTDHVDLLYLHAPDPDVPITDSAGALKSLLDAGKARCIGASNMNIDQLEQFHAVCPITAVQSPYNMLQRGIEAQLIPWCVEHHVSCVVYWPLMKGLLAGKLARDHVFAEGDGRAKYPMFQGEEWKKNQDFVDQMRAIAAEVGATVAQLVVAWTTGQSGITSVLCGAKRAYQIEETAGALGLQLDQPTLAKIDQALERRGEPIAGRAV
jgi:aryl-alcohol dehydrogenase-like predicted oxidoreductase